LKSIFANRVSRIVIVAMTLLSWFVLSNHCALGRLVGSSRAKSEHACCLNGKSGVPPAGDKQGVACCKSVRAIVPDGAKLMQWVPVFATVLIVAASSFEAQTQSPPVLAGDTGPPRAKSFSELVLHRSLRSHAPPFVA
jgi:hypothetical protein